MLQIIWSHWMPLAGLIIAGCSALIAFRSLRISYAQMRASVQQVDLGVINTQLGTLEKAHEAQLGLAQEQTRVCERELRILNERVTMQRDELMHLRDGQIQLLLEMRHASQGRKETL